jgi:hypothetical protein
LASRTGAKSGVVRAVARTRRGGATKPPGGRAQPSSWPPPRASRTGASSEFALPTRQRRVDPHQRRQHRVRDSSRQHRVRAAGARLLRIRAAAAHVLPRTRADRRLEPKNRQRPGARAPPAPLPPTPHPPSPSPSLYQRRLESRLHRVRAAAITSYIAAAAAAPSPPPPLLRLLLESATAGSTAGCGWVIVANPEADLTGRVARREHLAVRSELHTRDPGHMALQRAHLHARRAVH